jgi:hypothetical protein
MLLDFGAARRVPDDKTALLESSDSLDDISVQVGELLKQIVNLSFDFRFKMQELFSFFNEKLVNYC